MTIVWGLLGDHVVFVVGTQSLNKGDLKMLASPLVGKLGLQRIFLGAIAYQQMLWHIPKAVEIWKLLILYKDLVFNSAELYTKIAACVC